MLLKLSNLNSNLALSLGYRSPALNNSALVTQRPKHFQLQTCIFVSSGTQCFGTGTQYFSQDESQDSRQLFVAETTEYIFTSPTFSLKSNITQAFCCTILVLNSLKIDKQCPFLTIPKNCCLFKLRRYPGQFLCIACATLYLASILFALFIFLMH